MAGSEVQTLRMAFNGRGFARKVEKYCRLNGLDYRWRNDRKVPAFISLTELDVSGNPGQLRAFVEWGDRHYPRAGFAENFRGDDFMDDSPTDELA
jgi:hypothetical protein